MKKKVTDAGREYLSPGEQIREMDGRLLERLQIYEQAGYFGPRISQILQPVLAPEEGFEIVPEDMLPGYFAESGLAMYGRDYEFPVAGLGTIRVEVTSATDTDETIINIQGTQGVAPGVHLCQIRLQDSPRGVEMECRLRGVRVLEDDVWTDWLGGSPSHNTARAYFLARSPNRDSSCVLREVCYSIDLHGRIYCEAKEKSDDTWSAGFTTLGKYTAELGDEGADRF